MKIITLTLLILTVLVGCSEELSAPPTERLLPTIHVNKFLTYVNTQASLPAGHYQFVINADATVNSATYQLDVSVGDDTQTYTGEWLLGQPSIELYTLSQAGGFKISLNASAQLSLSIKRNGVHVLPTLATSTQGALEHNVASSQISNAEYSRAYYRAVDPNDARTTLTDWLSANGFEQGDDTYVVFRDTKDLGYGRSMFARTREDGGAAIYVDNYVVRLGGPSPANYGPLNVHAAVDQNQAYHGGTNAIEFSLSDPTDPDSPMITKFFTFSPADENGIQHRLLEADLDGRGVKPVPTTCISCHGGALLPLDKNGDFQLQALQTSKLNQLEVDSFEYSPLTGYTRADQAENLKTLNQIIANTFVQQQSQSDVKGKWLADFAIEVANGRYGNDFDNGTFNDGYIPDGWQQNNNRPAGVETLYKKVVEPHCISCHSLRGSEIGESVTVNVDGALISLANAVNFSSFEKFISLSDRITDYVYRRGQMPLSLRNYEKFWQNPQGKPTFLASFLPGFNVLDDKGEVQQPLFPFAKTTAPSQLASPGFILGEHSLFANVYNWLVLSQPSGSNLQLGQLNQPNLEIISATPGEYKFQLVVENDLGTRSDPSVITINVVDESTDTLITFDNQIRDLMGSSDNSSCSLCHRATGSYPNIPAYYADSNPTQYEDVRSRIDFIDPANSPILVKPTSLQHGGGVVIDRKTVDGERQYKLLLDWILAGAPCGSDRDFCDG